MNAFKFVFLAWVACPSAASWAQDYYAPTDKEKEPLARFPLDEIKIRSNPNGEKYITYTLPEMLTGETNTIVATELRLPGLTDLPHDVQIFTGPKATVTCMGSDDKPGCMVTHRNLNLNKVKAFAAIDRAYYDPQMRADARIISNDFQTIEHSGNQPIGILGGLKPRSWDFDKPATGTVVTKFDRNGIASYAVISWNNAAAPNFSASFILTDDPSDLNNKPRGKLTDIQYFGNRAHGRWSAGGQSGWFEFLFNNLKTRFEGYYGDGDNGSGRVGRWTTP